MNTLQECSKAGSAEAKRWFAVFSQPNKEATARAELAKQGFETFLPRRLKTVRHARRVTTRPSPVFPRYLFVCLDPKRVRWRSINGTRGVASLVSFGDGPTPVPRGVVEALMAACDGRGTMQFGDLLRVGQAVRLSAGPFAELMGTIDRLDGADAVRVLLDIMGRRVQVRARRDMVLPAA
jgi:transcriptional antiterminator RfaH